MLDGEGGACVWGRVMPAAESLRIGGLPIGLANRLKLRRDVAAGTSVTWSDVVLDEADETYRYRREMETAFAEGAAWTSSAISMKAGNR
jgi:predicted homoserine dehydrogenase-like protein